MVDKNPTKKIVEPSNSEIIRTLKIRIKGHGVKVSEELIQRQLTTLSNTYSSKA